jgi:hypothetical protein
MKFQKAYEKCNILKRECNGTKMITVLCFLPFFCTWLSVILVLITMVGRRCSHSNPQILWVCQLLSQHFVAVIQLILRWGDYLELSGWTTCKLKYPCKGDREAGELKGMWWPLLLQLHIAQRLQLYDCWPLICKRNVGPGM